jgi:hypothetical protein
MTATSRSLIHMDTMQKDPSELIIHNFHSRPAPLPQRAHVPTTHIKDFGHSFFAP